MKRQLIFIALITILFTSCTGFFDLRDEEKITGEVSDVPTTLTRVKFENKGMFPVDVFSSYTRDILVSKTICPVSPFSTSDEISWLPTWESEPFTFYYVYYLQNVYQDIVIPYIPPKKFGIDSASVNIPFEKTTPVEIPDITEIIDRDQSLIDDVGIIVRNYFSSTVQLIRGSLVLQPENSRNNSINNGAIGFYRVPANTTGYRIFSYNNDFHNISFGAPLTTGSVYVVTVYPNGTPAVTADFMLTMELFVSYED